MFVRTKTSAKGHLRVQVVESVRLGNKVSQRVVRHVGTATTEEQLRQLRQLGQTIIEEFRLKDSPQKHVLTPRQYAELFLQSRQAPQKIDALGVDLAQCREEYRLSAGVREALGEMYRQMGWERVLGARRMSGNRILQELVLARVAQPRSKRATVRDLADQGTVSLDLDRVYRTLDYLDEALVEKVCGQSLYQARQVLGEPLEAIFYDTTTLAFDSEEEDELRSKGYSKDGKPHRVQVMFALLVTPEGLPVGYELFPGKTYEGHTLIGAIETLRRRYPETRFTVVADAGLINQENEQALRKQGIPYVLGARLKSQTKAVKAKILDASGYRDWTDVAGVPVDRYRCIEVDEGLLVATASDRRARKDAADRERRLEKLQEKLSRNGQTASVSHRGYARFLTFPEGRVEIDGDKVAEAAKWDGLHGIKAWGYEEGTDPRLLVQQYRRLWEIESCFRINKHDLRIRPVFHWKPKRVRAHILVCYMAFCCMQHLRHRLRVMGHPMSVAEIQRALNGLQFSLLAKKGSRERFALPSRATGEARRIYRCLGLKWNEAPFAVQGKPPRKRKPVSGASGQGRARA